MHHFAYDQERLCAESVSVEVLVSQHGTPLYAYSKSTLEDHYRKLDQALAGVDHRILFAMKANSNLAVLKTLADLGAGFDIVSGGELFRAIKAGGAPSSCTFAGVGKTVEEIRYALEQGVLAFNVESEAELDAIDRVACGMGVKAPVALRVNPNVDAGTHSKITTGTYENKFGIAYEQIEAIYQRASGLHGIRLAGLQTHIGSQITTVAPFQRAIEKLAPLAAKLKDRFGISFFDIGGGLGIVYDPALESGGEGWWEGDDKPLTPATYAKTLAPIVSGLGLKILVEPGRFICGNAGILVARVLYVKKTGSKRFVIVDAAMNDLIRPAFYESYHQIVPVRRDLSRPLLPTDVVGPICESGDVFCKDRPLPEFQEGDLVAFLSAGAYGFAMSSNYNSRPRAAELLVSGDQAKVVRQRETWDDLIRGESL